MNQKSNNNDKSELSGAKSEQSLYTPLIDNDETQTSFEYLKGKVDEIIELHPKIFDLNLKEFFKDIASEEKKKY